METKDLEIRVREELEMLKDKSKGVRYNIVTILFLIALLVFVSLSPALYPYHVKKTFFIIFIVVLGCIGIGAFLFNYRFFKTIDTIETPDQLLNWFEKKRRVEDITGVAFLIVLIAYFVVSGFKFYFPVISGITALIIYRLFNGSFLSRNEKKILDELKELVEKE